MNQPLRVTYYDGVLSKPFTAQIRPANQDSIAVSYTDKGEVKTVYYHADEMVLLGKIGRRNPALELTHDARIEFHERQLPEWLPVEHKNFHQKVWKLERTPSLIIFSVLFVVALGFSVIKWGIPTASHIVAFQLPENTLNRLGGQAEVYLAEYTKPSQLSQQRQDRILADYLKYVADGHPAQLKFREGASLGANALALPNNTIYLTDELVKLAKNDQEIIGVLAHEQAHLLKRHSLQQGLSSLGFSVLYIAITGDGSDLIATLPVAMIGAGYSRKFELESDQYALELMHKHEMDTVHFANFLKRMSDDMGEDEDQSKILDLFASHPATEERIRRVTEFKQQQ
ncbi:M48 family metallopeptidase [Acinetobacter sp. Ver3]|uniref:M48 family metallopeptidase n=1 Tax=Acinetobacter sp. Ver3 TaxID=466088 RepID=UPI00054F50BA|nr:M48 family metallopeptidase [Acinetobacter sp. Ver3]